VPGGEHWYGIYNTPDILDLGQLIAAVNPGGNNLGSVSCRVNIDQSTIPFAPNDIPYLPAYYAFSSTHKPEMPLMVRLFFYNYELNALKAAAALPNATATDLVVTRFNGPVIDCSTGNNYTPPAGIGAVTLLTAVSPTTTSGTASFYLDVQTDSLGEFGAHFGMIPLPVELSRFSGEIKRESNFLTWTTASEHKTAHFLLERSLNGGGWTAIGEVPAMGNSSEVHDYSYTDSDPLPAAYYRLNIVDTDGKHQISNIIYLVRPEKTLSISRVFPSPTAGTSTLEFVSGQEEAVQVMVYDFTGRLVLTMPFEAQNGVNQAEIDLNFVHAGLYTVLVKSDHSVSSPAKVVRE
jgi:hypothetical protein